MGHPGGTLMKGLRRTNIILLMTAILVGPTQILTAHAASAESVFQHIWNYLTGKVILGIPPNLVITIHLASVPSGAEAYIDDNLIGSTNLSHNEEMPPHTFVIVYKLIGYRDCTRRILTKQNDSGTRDATCTLEKAKS